jgi:hypothetical protein
MLPLSLGLKGKPISASSLLHTDFLCFFSPDNGNMFLKRLNFNRLHGITSQKIELFITTAVRTSNPTIKVFLSKTIGKFYV